MEFQRRMRWEADEAERRGAQSRVEVSMTGGTDAADRDPLIAEAVRQAAQGSPDAMRLLYARYVNRVYRYVLSFVRDPHLAEDITQQAFLKVMSNIHRYEVRDVPFVAWLMRVARNAAMDQLRDNRTVPVEDVLSPTDSVDESGRERRRELLIALGRLAPDQRDVVVLRHLVGLSPGEIGQRMGRTEASIHGLHHRGRRALRHELAQLQAGPVLASRAA